MALRQGRLPTRLAEWFELGQAEASRLLPMEGLRGIAVILVFFVHYCTLVDPYIMGLALPVAAVLRTVGHAGVDLFFVLSGYLIYGTLIRRPQPFPGFMRRRVQRLYPAFAVLLGVYLVLSFLLPSESKLPSGAWNGFVYVLANLLLLPGIFSIEPIITVAWSLSYEMFFYLTVPLLIAMLRLRAWRPGARVAVFLAAVIAAQVLQLPHPRMGMFACGMILAELLPALRSRPRAGPALDPAALAAIPACGFVLLQDLPGAAKFTALFATCFLLCAAGFAHRGPVAGMLVVRPLRWLGNMSYSYYLVHGLVLKMVFFVLGFLPAVHRLGEMAFWVLLPPAFLLTLVGSALLFLLVERPFSIMPAERVRKAPVVDRTVTLATP
ncbi:acyltransferase [Siccirubricoccus sp. G192]|uniref:acyltransferase family protein n=1 Tax=Siccirubricoccus sp. G192 TaxID=2849651 RepID=UPI001C2C3F7B|nr:acyltransferase [Siccirubricoccus sp. G192]MBV1795751.1 acyltransferase [Siccirubricoccus sp. G192]